MSNTTPTPRNLFGTTKRTAAALITTIALLLALACNGGESSTAAENSQPEPATTSTQQPTISQQPGTDQSASPVNQGNQSSDDANTTAAASTRTADTTSGQQGQQANPTVPPAQQIPAGNQADTKHTAANAEQIARSQELYDLANLLAKLGRNHRALMLLEEAIVANPEASDAHILRALLTTLSRDPQTGLNQINATLKMDGIAETNLYALRSFAHSTLGDYEQALQDAETAREHIDHDSDTFALDFMEISTARTIALYRSGQYATIKQEEYDRDRHRREADEQIHRPEGTPHRYGLYEAYSGIDWNTTEYIGEADTNILLNPEQSQHYENRAGSHENLKWDTMAVQEYTKAAELQQQPAASHRLHLNKAQALMRLGRYQDVIDEADRLGPTSALRANLILALAHWRLGDNAAASRILDSFDYSDPSAIFDRYDPDSGLLNTNTRSGTELRTHLALKGAMAAAAGEMEEALRYLYIPTCDERFSLTPADERPRVGPRDEIIEHARRLAEQADRAERRGVEWREKTDARELWQWCDYPSELIDNPAAGAYVTATMRKPTDTWLPAGPRNIRYTIFQPDHDFTDPIIFGSTDPGLVHYITAWAQLAYQHPLIVRADAERAIQMDPTQANTHRVLAETYINLRSITLASEPLHEPAQAAYAKYEELASPENWEAARYHFARGAMLAWMENKQEAQAAFAQAAQLGYPEDAVREALNKLNQ